MHGPPLLHTYGPCRLILLFQSRTDGLAAYIIVHADSIWQQEIVKNMKVIISYPNYAGH